MTFGRYAGIVRRLARGIVGRGCCCEGSYSCESSEVTRIICNDWNPAWNVLYPLFRNQTSGPPFFYGPIKTDPYCQRVLIFCGCAKADDGFMMHGSTRLVDSTPDYVLGVADRIECVIGGESVYRTAGRIEYPPVYFGCADFNPVYSLNADQETWPCIAPESAQWFSDTAIDGVNYICAVRTTAWNWAIRRTYGWNGFGYVELPRSRIKLSLASVVWQNTLISNANEHGVPNCYDERIPADLCSIAT